MDEIHDNIRNLRDDVARHELLLEQVMSSLQAQFAEGTAPAWVPPSRGDELTSAVTPTMPVRRVAPIGSKSNDVDVVSRLRQTKMGKAYLNYLKQYSLVRGMVQWVWRTGYPIYVNHISVRLSTDNSKRWRALVKVSDFAKKSASQTYKLVDSNVVELSAPRVFPAADRSYLVSPHDRYIFPDIFVTIVQNAMVYGGTNLILVGNEVICHDLYDFARDYTSEELHGRTLIDPKTNRIRWLLHDDSPEPTPVAAAFVDACAPNYAHWITEVLPRIALFCADERFRDVPIVVNDGLHQNIMESLFMVAGPQREVIALSMGRGLAVDRLYLTSAAGYVPFERRTKKLTDYSHGVVSPEAFRFLNQRLKALVARQDPHRTPRKIYLRRNSGTRKVINASDIERLLVKHEFAVVEPEHLTFPQQVSLFANAEVVVAATGAACANIIFCKPQTRVTVMMAKHDGMPYRYWFNMAAPLGVNVSYVLGEIVDVSNLGIHGDFKVNLNDILDSVSRLGKA